MQRLIAGRFQLQRKLGEGTFAEIWLADDLHRGSPHKQVALKIFSSTAEGNPHSPWEPVFKEVAAGLRMPPHPHVIRVWAFIKAQRCNGRVTPCLIMEYVDGTNLALWLAQLAPLGIASIEARLTVMGDLLRALAHAHTHGVIHRDISFGNVLVRQSEPPRAFLTDFGCSQTEEKLSNATEQDDPPDMVQPINPPPYFRLLSIADGARRDIYAFATLCYLTLTSRHPLTDDWQSMRTGQWTGRQHPHATLPRRRLVDLASCIGTQPRFVALSDLLLRCIAADPAARPETAATVLTEWHRALEQA